MLSFSELPEFARVMESDVEQESTKVLHLRRQVATLLHQHFRKRWPTSLPDWSPEEVARGLDRPTGNRALGCFAVDLQSMGVPYINAARVPGLAPSPLSYVATQHPLPATVGDFWRMVLHLRPAAVVMLNGAAASVADAGGELPQYWLPSSLVAGEELILEARGETCDKACDCVVRTLRCVLGEFEWTGPQLVVSWWRDQSEPDLERFLALEQLLESYVTVENGQPPPPVLVHCAAGIGRAGVFIGADCGARAAALGADTALCSPDKLVAHLRQCRMNMVQTAEQYEFLHRVLPPLVAQLRRARGIPKGECVGGSEGEGNNVQDGEEEEA